MHWNVSQPLLINNIAFILKNTYSSFFFNFVKECFFISSTVAIKPWWYFFCFCIKLNDENNLCQIFILFLPMETKLLKVASIPCVPFSYCLLIFLSSNFVWFSDIYTIYLIKRRFYDTIVVFLRDFRVVQTLFSPISIPRQKLPAYGKVLISLIYEKYKETNAFTCYSGQVRLWRFFSSLL